MIWIAYADEAGIDDRVPIMAMGGFLSTEDRWIAFDRAWAELVHAHGIEYSHADDLVRRKKAFSGWSDLETQRLCVRRTRTDQQISWCRVCRGTQKV
jgi:hypothetical protein